ncbi:SAF domain-containing protein [Paenibacillus sp. MBLB4367]|uniref:SAF domain-containing protein n=1 Tax=Paenibacillus sp. MBLB4367 TaxID=3384767 RepID=UPI0039081C8B
MLLNRGRSVTISLIAGLLACVLVYGVYQLQLKQLRLQETVDVVVPKDFIRSGTLLTADMMELKPVVRGSYREGMVASIDAAAGKEALLPLGRGEPVLDWKLDRFHLLPRGDQATFQIPKEYVLSLSNGIRAGDAVKLYVSGKEGSRPLFGHDVVVASVKSAANVEIDDPKNPNLYSRASGDMEKMYAARREANGAIDQINLNLTEQEWLTIDEACRDKKARLVIAFASSSIVEMLPGQ